MVLLLRTQAYGPHGAVLPRRARLDATLDELMWSQFGVSIAAPQRSARLGAGSPSTFLTGPVSTLRPASAQGFAQRGSGVNPASLATAGFGVQAPSEPGTPVSAAGALKERVFGAWGKGSPSSGIGAGAAGGAGAGGKGVLSPLNDILGIQKPAVGGAGAAVGVAGATGSVMLAGGSSRVSPSGYAPPVAANAVGAVAAAAAAMASGGGLEPSSGGVQLQAAPGSRQQRDTSDTSDDSSSDTSDDSSSSSSRWRRQQRRLRRQRRQELTVGRVTFAPAAGAAAAAAAAAGSAAAATAAVLAASPLLPPLVSVRAQLSDSGESDAADFPAAAAVPDWAAVSGQEEALHLHAAAAAAEACRPDTALADGYKHSNLATAAGADSVAYYYWGPAEVSAQQQQGLQGALAGSGNISSICSSKDPGSRQSAQAYLLQQQRRARMFAPVDAATAAAAMGMQAPGHPHASSAAGDEDWLTGPLQDSAGSYSSSGSRAGWVSSADIAVPGLRSWSEQTEQQLGVLPEVKSVWWGLGDVYEVWSRAEGCSRAAYQQYRRGIDQLLEGSSCRALQDWYEQQQFTTPVAIGV